MCTMGMLLSSKVEIIYICIFMYLFTYILQLYTYLWNLHILLTSTTEKPLKKSIFAFWSDTEKQIVNEGPYTE